jgi:hypothetical protein
MTFSARKYVVSLLIGLAFSLGAGAMYPDNQGDNARRVLSSGIPEGRQLADQQKVNPPLRCDARHFDHEGEKQVDTHITKTVDTTVVDIDRWTEEESFVEEIEQVCEGQIARVEGKTDRNWKETKVEKDGTKRRVSDKIIRVTPGTKEHKIINHHHNIKEVEQQKITTHADINEYDLARNISTLPPETCKSNKMGKSAPCAGQSSSQCAGQSSSQCADQSSSQCANQNSSRQN